MLADLVAQQVEYFSMIHRQVRKSCKLVTQNFLGYLQLFSQCCATELTSSCIETQEKLHYLFWQNFAELKELERDEPVLTLPGCSNNLGLRQVRFSKFYNFSTLFWCQNVVVDKDARMPTDLLYPGLFWVGRSFEKGSSVT